jgi:hypothetical protein
MRLVIAIILFLVSLNAFSDSKKCDNASSCIESNYFSANVTKVSKRGKIFIIQIRYLSEVGVNSFDVDFKGGFASLLDANGNEFLINGKNIIGFSIRRKEKRVLSLKFKSNGENQIAEPFDLTIKGSKEHGEITFFNLKSK